MKSRQTIMTSYMKHDLPKISSKLTLKPDPNPLPIPLSQKKKNEGEKKIERRKIGIQFFLLTKNNNKDDVEVYCTTRYPSPTFILP